MLALSYGPRPERQSSKVGTSRDGDRNGTANYLNISCEARKLTSPAVAPSSATRPHPTQAIRWRPLAGPPPGSRDEMRLPLCVKCGRFRPKTMILCVGRRAGREFCRAPTLYGRQRPYHVDYTGSRQITEVKHHRARLVRGWVSAGENCVLLAPLHFFPFNVATPASPLFTQTFPLSQRYLVLHFKLL